MMCVACCHAMMWFACVQKLEGELKQSYATKNFTLKSGLLEIEKKYRASIYGHEELEVGVGGGKFMVREHWVQSEQCRLAVGAVG